MNGFVRKFIFGGAGNRWKTHKLESDPNHQQNKLRENTPIIHESGNDEEKRIIQLEMIVGSLLGVIRDKNLIDDDELKSILDLAESEAKLAKHLRTKKSQKYRYHS